MVDYKDDLKRKVAEFKFLIHDLRVEKFANDIMHFHVTLNTDLEIYNIDQAQVLHKEDLLELKRLACEMRKTFQLYTGAVRNFSPDEKIIKTGDDYIKRTQEICELILNPLWGRFDKVIAFLPEGCRSAKSRSHYRNCIRCICGVYYRIEYFYEELNNKKVYYEFDLAEDIYFFANNVIYGFVTEKSASRTNIQLEKINSAVIGGNKPRFRRMVFNLVMNAVNAMQDERVGLLKIKVYKDTEKVYLQLQDNGKGLQPDKIRQLLSVNKSLDGELSSLGFIFINQTVKEFNGKLSIDSEVGKGTTMTIQLPFITGKKPPIHEKSKCEKYLLFKLNNNTEKQNITYFDREKSENKVEKEIAHKFINTEDDKTEPIEKQASAIIS